jgi:hypothetical protein
VKGCKYCGAQIVWGVGAYGPLESVPTPADADGQVVYWIGSDESPFARGGYALGGPLPDAVVDSAFRAGIQLFVRHILRCIGTSSAAKEPDPTARDPLMHGM